MSILDRTVSAFNFICENMCKLWPMIFYPKILAFYILVYLDQNSPASRFYNLKLLIVNGLSNLIVCQPTLRGLYFKYYFIEQHKIGIEIMW